MHESNLESNQAIKKILAKMASYCAYQERCQQDVRMKLKEFMLQAEEIDFVIYWLVKEKFINETRFAQSFVRGKFNSNKWGKSKIKSHLKAKDINDKITEIALREIDDEDYEQLIKKLVNTKKTSLKTTDKLAVSKKVSNYLLQKGFEYEDFKNFL